MAKAAVITSMPMIQCRGKMVIRKAPSGGVAMCMMPYRVWFMPATRGSCSSGTISEVEACMAGW